MRLIIRRPHAYKFRAKHRQASIPGVVILNRKGEYLGGVDLRSKTAVSELLDLLDR